MTHPLLLHFRASSWSLNAARAALAERARVEAEQIAAEQAETAHDGIRSTVYGVRSGNGSHGDPAAATALLGVNRAPRINLFQQLAESVYDTLQWMAVKVDVARQDVDPLNCLLDAVPRLRPLQAANLTLWIDEADHNIRRSLQLAPNLWALPGSPPCPSCRMVSLFVQTAAPSHLWTVICRAGCVCAGTGCSCSMPVRVEGAAHIWDASAPFVAAALAGVAPYLPTAATPEGTTDIALPGLVAVRWASGSAPTAATGAARTA